MGPMMRVALPEIVAVLLIAVLMTAAGAGFAMEKGLDWAAYFMDFFSGFCVGYAVTHAVAARKLDDDLREEIRKEALTLTQAQKENFGGFRRVE